MSRTLIFSGFWMTKNQASASVSRSQGIRRDLATHMESIVDGSFNNVDLTFESHNLLHITMPTFVTDHPVLWIINNFTYDCALTINVQLSIVSYIKMLVKTILVGFDKLLVLIAITHEKKLEEKAKNTVSAYMYIAVKEPLEVSECMDVVSCLILLLGNILCKQISAQPWFTTLIS